MNRYKVSYLLLICVSLHKVASFFSDAWFFLFICLPKVTCHWWTDKHYLNFH